MQPIRVLQVFTVLNRGGAEANIMNYYRTIDRSKIQFDFLVHREEEGVFEKEIIQLGGRIFRLPPVDPRTLKTYKKAVKAFFDQHPEYQIIHGQLSELGVFIYEEAQRRNIPVIIAHAHNPTMSWDKKALFRLWWKYRMRSSVNTFFTCGVDSAKWLFGNKLAEKAYPMNNAIDTDKYSVDLAKRDKIRTQLGSGKVTNVVNVARFDKQKNHLFLLEVFTEVLKINSDYHLYLIGDGELKYQIQNKIKELEMSEKVTLLGVRNDVDDLLQAMDIFLFPSLYEGLGVAFIEAQASGIRCFVSEGIPEEAILVKENVRVVSLKKKPLEWAEQITKDSAYDRKDVSQMIKQKSYDIKQNATSLVEKYLELLQEFS